jgi:hypothetical protein
MTNLLPLPGKVTTAAPGLKGFDADTIITSELAAEFIKNGYQFCARYLSLGEGQNPGDLSNGEAADILNSGLALIAVQHVNAYGWAPTSALGTTHGSNAASNARSIGLPTGMNLWCDLEGVATGTDAEAVINYCTAWYNAVAAASYVPGLYVGPIAVLDGQQLYDLPFQHYWKSASNVPEIPVRGYQLVQGLTITASGIEIDPDTTQTDAKGGAVLWVAVS